MAATSLVADTNCERTNTYDVVGWLTARESEAIEEHPDNLPDVSLSDPVKEAGEGDGDVSCEVALRSALTSSI